MNHIQTLQKAGIDTTYIQSIEDNSDRLFTRMFITFKNGLHLSVIQGEFSYGGKDKGLYEIAPMNKNHSFAGSKLMFAEDHGNDIIGYCDVGKVRKYIETIGVFKDSMEHTLQLTKQG